MSGKLLRHAFQQLVDEDIAWLLAQPRTLERDHVEQILRDCILRYYPPESTPTSLPPSERAEGERTWQQERAAVVAWLRGYYDPRTTPRNAADDIERGEHINPDAAAPLEQVTGPPFEFTGTCDVCHQLVAGKGKRHKECETGPTKEESESRRCPAGLTGLGQCEGEEGHGGDHIVYPDDGEPECWTDEKCQPEGVGEGTQATGPGKETP